MRSRFLFWIGLATLKSIAATPSFQLDTASRLATHLVTPTDLASHRHQLQASLNFPLDSHFSFVVGGRAFVEGAYAANENRYGTNIQTLDSHELRLRELYAQYKSGPLLFKLGNQEVVWGEAFGFYYADIVNPKDLRDFGLGPLAKNRIPVPMANVKVKGLNSSLQLLLIPYSQANQTPRPGSDFAFPFSRFYPRVPLAITETRSQPLRFSNVEWGLRLQALLGEVDTSLLYLNYFNRLPNFASQFQLGGVSIDYSYQRMQSYGITTSVPIGPLMLRSEALYHLGKRFDSIGPTGLLVPINSDELVGVLGLDYSRGDQLRLGIQVAENYRMKTIASALSPRSNPNLSLHFLMSTLHEQSIETIWSYTPEDGSQLLQANYLIPLSKSIEFQLGADVLWGGAASEFGQFHSASRASASIRSFFGSPY